jgi:type II secretory pathway pseudopilin PulG
MKTASRGNSKSGMTRVQVAVVIFILLALVALLGIGACGWKKEQDRSTTILNIRNCQQAMRGHQGMKSLWTGKPFTKRDLETYMPFPSNIPIFGGEIVFDAGEEKVTPLSAEPAVNGDHLWLKVAAPNTTDYVGDYGFRKIAESTGW